MRNKIIIMAVSLIVLVGAYFAITKINPKKVEEPSKTPETISVFKIEQENIESVSIKTPDFNYTISKSNENWVVLNMPNATLEKSSVEGLVSSFASIYADSIITENGNLSDYGLDKPAGTPSIKLKDGTEKQFIIGNQTPTGNGYYFKIADNSTVYSVYTTTCSKFLDKLDAYRFKELAKVDEKSIEKFAILRKDMNIILQAKPQTDKAEKSQEETAMVAAWEMISPMKRDCNGEIISKQIFDVLNFSIKDYVDDAPYSYAKYGLDVPRYKIELKEMDKEQVTVLLGNETEGKIYAKLQNSPNVYTIDLSSVSYKDIDPFIMVDTLIYLQNIDKVNSITFYANNETTTLAIAKSGETLTYTVNGNDADESKFKKTYQSIIGLTLRSTASGNVGNKVMCKFVFNFNDGRADDTVEVVEYGDRTAAVKINGKSEYVIMKSQVSDMISAVKEFANNPK